MGLRWLTPLWAVVRSAVRRRLHELVDSVDEEDVERFRERLHTCIDLL
ncbi:MAG: hypothetical protein IT209_03130 [Armatimonadetes bacterium]|nr:hypothetical protein [Armatimonadota bacterium]